MSAQKANLNIGEVLEALTEGVAVFDNEKQLLASNTRYDTLDPERNSGRLVQVREHKTPNGKLINLRTDVTEVRRRDRAFAVLLEKGSISPHFLEAAVEALATGLGYKWAGIGRFTKNHKGVQLEAYWNIDRIDEPFSYMLHGTPCDQVLEQVGFCFYPTDTDMLFPEDKMFVDMKIKAYQGTVVFGIDGTPLGHIFAFHDQPDAAPQGHREFLRVIADWVSLEFRRRHAEEQKDAAEKELRQHQKLEAIGQLAGGIAHEINTPIQYIGDNLRFLDEANHSLRRLIDAYRSLAQAAETQGILQEEQRELAGAIAEIDLDYYLEETPRATSESLAGIVQVSSIVSAMKEFSHPSTVIKGPVDINHILENSVTVSRSEWREVAEIKYGLAPDLPRPLGMAGELGQVFLNVIVNAAHAIKLAQRGPGTITIRTHANQDSVEIDIEDTGTGIPVEIRERIFDPFFTTKDVGQGTGQGLTFSHDIVTRKHGGSLTFTTETGKGTCFTIRLPIAKKA